MTSCILVITGPFNSEVEGTYFKEICKLPTRKKTSPWRAHRKRSQS